MNGIIKMYNRKKCYGFIHAEDQQDYFFHISDSPRLSNIQIGRPVSFQTIKRNNKVYAINVFIIDTMTDTITLGNSRYRMSNIKRYKIGEYTFIRRKIIICKTFSHTKNIILQLLKLCLDIGLGKTVYIPTKNYTDWEIFPSEELNRIDITDFSTTYNLDELLNSCLDSDFTLDNLDYNPFVKIEDYCDEFTQKPQEAYKFPYTKNREIAQVYNKRYIYLYFETYQREYNMFMEHSCNFDLRTACKQLDNYFHINHYF